MTILITGAAGFIGSYVALALLDKGEGVIGVDNLNNYYSPALKRARLDRLAAHQKFRFVECDIADHATFFNAVKDEDITAIIHLAAQAGVRYSIENPFAYSRSNLEGHLSVLETARKLSPPHLVYASSSSVYGANETAPFSERQSCDKPVSFYGATKKANEVMSQSYARLYELPQTGLRFFTVYGPWGRPDMAYWIFTEKMLKGQPIDVFNKGDMGRDFTYIDDIVDGVLAALAAPPSRDADFHRIYNLGNDRPESLYDLIEGLEKELGIHAKKNLLPMQPGDVKYTWANIERARNDLGYAPKTTLAEGLARFVEWRRCLAAPFV